MTNYIEMHGKQLAIKTEAKGTYRLVEAKTGKPVMCGFETVKKAIYWTKINWN